MSCQMYNVYDVTIFLGDEIKHQKKSVKTFTVITYQTFLLDFDLTHIVLDKRYGKKFKYRDSGLRNILH